MNGSPARLTVDERYATAVDSSHLEVEPDRRCDVDMLIAAGWVRDGLGTSLYRLRVEWDAVQTEHRTAVGAMRFQEARAAAKDREAWQLEQKGQAAAASALREIAAAVRKSASAAALTEQTMLLARLKGLRQAREAVHAFGRALAARARLSPDDPLVGQVSAKALDLWLNDGCPACEGRGFNGGFGSPLVLCARCGGTGKRAQNLHHSSEWQAFGRLLLSQLDRKADHVTGLMRRFLAHRRAADPEFRASAMRILSKELERLRSSAAQED